MGLLASTCHAAFYDYIVVGAGSAGSIVATRLAQNGSTVLVIDGGEGSTVEVGGKDVVGTQGTLSPSNTYTPVSTFTKYDVPLYWSAAYITGLKWDITGASVAKVTGGCGMHNGMVFQRGLESDYNNWGVTGWNWSSMFPYFLKIETILDPSLSTSTLHGHSGPINVGTHPFDQEGNDFISSCSAAGLPFNPDFQNNTRDGCGYFQFNIDPTGIRSSPFHKYLKPALVTYSSTLKLLTQVTVLKVNFIKACTSCIPNAASVTVSFNGNGTVSTITCNKEIILSAGALNTPKILLNSGIGNATYLATYSSVIPTVYSNLPGVGRNLQNHFLAFTVWSYNATSNRPTFYDLFTQSLFFETSGAGILGTPGFSVGAWLRPNATAVGVSENVMLILPGVLGTTTPFQALSIGVSISRPAPNNHFIQLNADQSGTANAFYLRSPDLHFTLLNKQADVDTLVRGIQESRRIMSFAPMNGRAAPVIPAPDQTTAELATWVQANAIAHDHWCCTAKMSSTPSDTMAVVDNHLRVLGVKKLRVIDASVMPTIVDSLVHATVMAIAEAGADYVIADNMPPPSTTGTTTTTGGGGGGGSGGLLSGILTAILTG
ncbi:hypothetical protein SAMD00019534_023900 [Acytostelium subglobosum LB1]|uniref:hypothetical protein n=1 Tax=Acytostelium subglobosum LB1 TaxID=1410327 RepID=UPI000644C59C|nr:hypothetical protein SAMD00019534_023900 [Acytostelium subglobosum LB1]GAM19215.1 hypothetical protein SAMD00019534_023900 [Acytostelium subglobosum LB1]|eukprot:XP_012757142.1 hypothetical protein SAMD00019534_023900 [Acytostelium subglobosum LB1]